MQSPSHGGAGPLADTCIVLASFFVPCLFGYAFLWPWMFTNYENKRREVQFMFATTFALSINILLLTVYEVADILHNSMRYLTWQLVLTLMLVVLVFVLPYTFFYVFIADITSLERRKAQFLALLAQLLFLYGFWQCGALFPVAPAAGNTSFEGLLGRVAVIGTTTAALLAGYGTVARPYDLYLTFFVKPVGLSEVAEAQKKLREFNDAIIDLQRRTAYNRYLLDQAENPGENALIQAARAALADEDRSRYVVQASSQYSTAVVGVGVDSNGGGAGAVPSSFGDAPSHIASACGGFSARDASSGAVDGSGSTGFGSASGEVTEASSYSSPNPTLRQRAPLTPQPAATRLTVYATPPPQLRLSAPTDGGHATGAAAASTSVPAINGGVVNAMAIGPAAGAMGMQDGGGVDAGWAAPRELEPPPTALLKTPGMRRRRREERQLYSPDDSGHNDVVDDGSNGNSLQPDQQQRAHNDMRPSISSTGGGGGGLFSSPEGSWSGQGSEAGTPASSTSPSVTSPYASDVVLHRARHGARSHGHRSRGSHLSFGGLTSDLSSLVASFIGQVSALVDKQTKSSGDTSSSSSSSSWSRSSSSSSSVAPQQSNHHDAAHRHGHSAHHHSHQESVADAATRKERIHELRAEIEGQEEEIKKQEDLQSHQLEILIEMRDVQRRHTFNATWLGWAWNVLSAILAVYGAKSMLDAARVLFFKMEPTTSSIIAWLSDPTSTPSRILSHLVSVPPDYIKYAVQPVSFALVFTMAVSSVPGFLNSFMKMFMSLSRDLTSNSVVLLLAEVMGSFFLAQVLQVRMNIPENKRENMIRAMGNMNFNFLYLWQHGVTLMSAITAGVLFVAYAATSYVASDGRNSKSNSSQSANGFIGTQLDFDGPAPPSSTDSTGAPQAVGGESFSQGASLARGSKKR